jgi:HTTM domain
VTAMLAAWERFWFAPIPTSTIAVVRMAFGLVMVGWTVSMAPDLLTFWAQDGLVPQQPPEIGWGLLGYFPSDAAVIGVFVALLVTSVCVLVGFLTRFSCAVLFVCLLAFVRRDPFVLNSGDLVLVHVAFFLALSPAGAAISLDRFLFHRGKFWEVPARAPWGLRLMQIQVSMIYFFAVWAKVRGVTWNDGTAVSYALRLDQLERFPEPGFLSSQPIVVNLLTYGTLAVELSIAILVWNRRVRPYVLAAGVLLHLLIDWSLVVGFFTLSIYVLYLSFLSPEWALARFAALRRLLERNRRASPRGESRVITPPRLDSER